MSWLWCVAFAVGAFVLLRWLYSERRGEKQFIRGSIFVTGCDSGMGRVSAERLAERGFDVIFGCYLQESVDQINSQKSPFKSAIKIDVTSDDSVNAAAAAVASDKCEKKKKYEIFSLFFWNFVHFVVHFQTFFFFLTHPYTTHSLTFDCSGGTLILLLALSTAPVSPSKVPPSTFQWLSFNVSSTSISSATFVPRRPSFHSSSVASLLNNDVVVSFSLAPVVVFLLQCLQQLYVYMQ
jgi:hypothetical protein